MGEGVNLKIVELFKSIEGEGIRTGSVCTFIRAFGCPCRCTYCDSMYANETGHGMQIEDMTVEEIVNFCKQLKTPYVTITGGEPLIQPEINELIEALLQDKFQVNIETSGACDISMVHEYFAQKRKHPLLNNLIFTVDYKSFSSGCTGLMIMQNFTKHIRSSDVVKFVVGSKEDLDQMKSVVEKVKLHRGIFSPHFFVSPIFGVIEPKEIVEYLKDNDLFDVRMQLQAHKFIWPSDMKGV